MHEMRTTTSIYSPPDEQRERLVQQIPGPTPERHDDRKRRARAERERRRAKRRQMGKRG
jgi:hypothetical protein